MNESDTTVSEEFEVGGESRKWTFCVSFERRA